MSNWTDLSREKLITEYRKHPCLWSPKDADSKNAEVRRKCLDLIATEVNKLEKKHFSSDDVRTQFKNLRDMYRRKRKKIQFQQEINPGAAVDEPGWVYFSRLKFLDDVSVDFGPPNEAFSSSSTTGPPPKKKGKTTSTKAATTSNARRVPDDSSLPTHLDDADGEEEKNISNLEQQKIQQQQRIRLEIKKEKIDEGENDEEEEEEEEGDEEEQELDYYGEDDDDDEMLETLEKYNNGQPNSSSFGGGVAATSAKKSTSSSTAVEENNDDEFACFGRFVAVALRKIAARSPLGALEARKELGDVLYRAERSSLQEQQEK